MSNLGKFARAVVIALVFDLGHFIIFGERSDPSSWFFGAAAMFLIDYLEGTSIRVMWKKKDEDDPTR